MPIVMTGTVTLGKRIKTGEYVLDVFPPYVPGETVRTPHVEAQTLPEALRKLADQIEEHGSGI